MQTLGYLGWQGRGNFGDDLIHHAWRVALEGRFRLVEMPLYPSDRRQIARALTSARLRRVKTVLIGGGTVIGFENWSRHAMTALKLTGARQAVAIGCGAPAVDDRAATTLQRLDWASWQTSKLIVRGVRGPLSLESITVAGLPSTGVIGDSALLYDSHKSWQRESQVGRFIGLALGNDSGSSFELETILDAVTQYKSGDPEVKIKVFALSTRDQASAQLVLSALKDSTGVIYTGDVDFIMRELATCEVVLSERLHGCIAAAAVGVPSISLAYLSKCVDFMLSIGRAQWVAPVGVSSSALHQLLRKASASDRAELNRAVEGLRISLRAEVDALSDAELRTVSE